MHWTPLTCNPDPGDSCQVEVDNDWNFIRFVKKCSAHQNLTDDAAGFSVLYTPQNTGENQRGGGNALAEILDKGPTSLYDVATDGSRTFKRGITVSWAWSGSIPNRVLNITVSGITLTTQQKNNIQSFLDNRFGAGKTTVTQG